MYFRYFSFLCLILIFKAIIMSLLILTEKIGLGPDESQYWTWSQLLDLGYYSKPPGIAWQIKLGTYLFGNTEFGVRSMSIVIGTAIPVLVYITALSCRIAPMSCFIAALGFAFSPLGILSSFLAITDGGMVLFLTAAIACFIDSIEKNKAPHYLLIGLFIACGAIFKWPIYLLWIAFLLSHWFLPNKAIINWKMIPGIVISLVALLPGVYWNATHEWATFRHVFATLGGGHGQPQSNVGEFLGAQALLASPIFFAMIAMAFWSAFIQKTVTIMSPGVRFCTIISFASLILGTIASIFMKIQGNWAIFAYPPAFVVLGWFISSKEKKYRQWFFGGLCLSIALCGIVFGLSLMAKNPLSFKINPFRHNVGWKQLTESLTEAGYDPKNDFLAGDKYQMASTLSFYGPGQKRAYFLNIQGTRKNQFSFWPGLPEEQLGKRGFFVITENAPKLNTDAAAIIDTYTKELSKYFAKVIFLKIAPLYFSDEETVKGAFIFECIGYNGLLPPDSELY